MATVTRSESLTSEGVEAFLAKVYDILDSYDFDRFPEVFASDLQYLGGLEKNSSLESFIQGVKKSVESMPPMKTSHSRWKNDITSQNFIYSHGHSTAEIGQESITIPMIGVYELVKDGPESGKIKYMAIYKDRLPFLRLAKNLPGRG